MTTKISTLTAVFWKDVLISKVQLWILYRRVLSISDKMHGYSFFFFYKKGTKMNFICSLFKINSSDLDLKQCLDFYFHSRTHYIMTFKHCVLDRTISPCSFFTSCFMNVLFKGRMLPKQSETRIFFIISRINWPWEWDHLITGPSTCLLQLHTLALSSWHRFDL